MMKTITALLAATMLTAGTVATVNAQTAPQAAPKQRMMRDPMMRADTNKDGILTRAEVTAQVDAHFGLLDSNKDGKITVEERKALREAMGGRMGKRMANRMEKRMARRGPEGGPGAPDPGMKNRLDADKDGAISLDEQRTVALKRFEFVDRNGDGKVDQAERELVHGMLMEMGGAGPDGRGHHGRRGPGRHGGDMPPPPPPAAPKG